MYRDAGTRFHKPDINFTFTINHHLVKEGEIKRKEKNYASLKNLIRLFLHKEHDSPIFITHTRVVVVVVVSIKHGEKSS